MSRGGGGMERDYKKKRKTFKEKGRVRIDEGKISVD
jgi:hypothetical protein